MFSVTGKGQVGEAGQNEGREVGGRGRKSCHRQGVPDCVSR